MEVEKEDVIDRKTGERIQQPAYDGKLSVSDISSQIDVCGKGTQPELENQQRTEGVRRVFRGEEHRQPEERRAQQIEAVGSDKVCAQIGISAPRSGSRDDRVMRQLIERNLLYIEVAVV